VAKMLAEIPQALAAFPKQRLTMIYELIGMWLHESFQDLLEKSHASTAAYIKQKTGQQ
jgi:hypothetical protein